MYTLWICVVCYELLMHRSHQRLYDAFHFRSKWSCSTSVAFTHAINTIGSLARYSLWECPAQLWRTPLGARHFLNAFTHAICSRAGKLIMTKCSCMNTPLGSGTRGVTKMKLLSPEGKGQDVKMAPLYSLKLMQKACKKPWFCASPPPIGGTWDMCPLCLPLFMPLPSSHLIYPYPYTVISPLKIWPLKCVDNFEIVSLLSNM